MWKRCHVKLNFTQIIVRNISILFPLLSAFAQGTGLKLHIPFFRTKNNKETTGDQCFMKKRKRKERSQDTLIGYTYQNVRLFFAQGWGNKKFCRAGYTST